MAEYTNHEIELIGERREAAKEAEEKEKKEMAKKMLKDNVSVELIAKYTSLSIDEIKALLI